MRPGLNLILNLTLAAACLTPAAGSAAAKPPPAADYDRDVISVVTLSRHTAFPSATCLVWANAEGLGVGPAQLGGMHGLSFNINPQPLADEAAKQPTTFAQGLADLKARFPTAPAWLVGAVEKHQAAIETACLKDQPTPFTVYKLTKKDRPG